jgi:hypothetical protein
MKIFIDYNDAKRSSLGEFYQFPQIDHNGICLPIHVKKQLKSRWCWVAIACAVGEYYQTCNLRQKDLVRILLKDIDNKESQYSKGEIKERNINFKLDIALKFVNGFSHWTIGKPSFERIQFEINQGRPVCIRLEWFKGGAHYVLVRGYNSEQETIFIEDSLHGSGIESFKNFPDKYCKSGAVWTETFWTSKIQTN